VASSLFIEVLQSGATPWAIIILVAILVIRNVATCILRMIPICGCLHETESHRTYAPPS
jgi:hypothetical protein